MDSSYGRRSKRTTPRRRDGGSSQEIDEAEGRRPQLRLEESSSAGNIQPRLSSGEASEARARDATERIRSTADGRSTWARRCLALSSMISWRWAFTYPIASAFIAYSLLPASRIRSGLRRQSITAWSRGRYRRPMPIRHRHPSMSGGLSGVERGVLEHRRAADERPDDTRFPDRAGSTVEQVAIQ